MSGRYQDHNKGSSRGTRDDSRLYKDRHDSGGRSRSRSPRRRSPAHSSDYAFERSTSSRDSDRRDCEVKGDDFSLHSSSTSRDRDRKDFEASSSDYSYERSSKSRDRDRRAHAKSHSKSQDWDDDEEVVPPPPPPPRITKISIGFTKPKAPIKMNLAGPAKSLAKPTVASVFSAEDDDDDPEEMPAEARMRMRNIGRETPTSAGPNSFGKTKQGFCDAKKVFEKNLKSALESNERPPMPNLPQTIYRIKGP